MTVDRPIRRFRGDDGAVLVEAALVLPIILFVMLGMTEYSVAEFQANQASSAARDGARVGILDYKQADVTGSAANNAVVAAAQARLTGQKNVTVTVTCLKSDGSTVACANAVPEQDRIQVVVSWPYAKITGIVPVVPKTITATSRMALVGQVLSMSTTTSTPSSTSSTSSTSTSSTSSTTTTAPPACTVVSVVPSDGGGVDLPKLNGNSGNLKTALNVKVTTNGSASCLPVSVTVYPGGQGAAVPPALTANGVAGAAGVYTTIFGEKAATWKEGPLLIRVSWSGGTQDLTVTLSK